MSLRALFLLSLAFSPLSIHCADYVSLEAFSSQKEDELEHRRIAALCQKGDHSLARQRIASFLQLYPESPYREAILALRGRIAYREGLWHAALQDFERLTQPSLINEVESDRLHCLYRMNKYREVMRLTREGAEQAKLLDLKANERLALHLFFHSEALLRQWIADDDDLAGLRSQIGYLSSSFLHLKDSRYAAPALSSLAEAYQLIGEAEAAAACCRELAEAAPQLQSLALYQEARLLADTQPAQAFELFMQVGELQEREAGPALLAAAALCAQLANPDDVERLERALSADAIGMEPELAFHLGLAYVKLKDSARAKHYLSRFIRADGADPLLYVHALENLAQLAWNAGDTEGLQSLVGQLRASKCSPQLQTRCCIYLASLLNHQGLPGQALAILRDHDLKQVSDSERHAYQSQLAQAHLGLGNWREAYQTFLSVLEHAEPGSEVAAYCARAGLESGLRWCQSLDSDDLNPQIIRPIALAIQHASRLSSEGSDLLCRYSLGLAEQAFRGADYALAIELLQAVPDGALSPEWRGPYSALLAHCHYQKAPESLAFIEETERALRYHTEPKTLDPLRRCLVQAYLSRAAAGEGDAFRLKAAEHLELLDGSETAPLHSQQLAWLGLFYAKRAMTLDSECSHPSSFYRIRDQASLDKALGFLQRTVGLQSDRGLLLWLGRCLTAHGRHEECRALLDPYFSSRSMWPSTVELQEVELLFLFANSLVEAKAPAAASNAAEWLRGISLRIRDSQQSMRYQLVAARLSLAALEQLRPSPQREKGWEVTMGQLQRLQAAKRIETEPYHLEAALLLVDAQATAARACDSPSVATQALIALRNDFNDAEDLWNKEYQEALEQDLSARARHDAYMLLVDARLAQAKAAAAAMEGEEVEATAHAEAAQSLLALLEAQHFPISNYLLHEATLWDTEPRTPPKAGVVCVEDAPRQSCE